MAARHLTDVRRQGSDMVYSMHRSVQRSILDILDNDYDKRQTAFNQAVSLIYQELPKPSPIMVPLLEGFDLYATYAPHVTSLHRAYIESQPPISPTTQFAEMICSAATYFYEIGLAESCLAVASTGEQVCRQLSRVNTGSENVPESTPHPKAVVQNNMDVYNSINLVRLEANIIAYGAGVLWTTGGIANRQQAHDMTWRVLELRKQYIEETPKDQLSVDDHILLANAYNDVCTMSPSLFSLHSRALGHPQSALSNPTINDCGFNNAMAENHRRVFSTADD